MNKWFWLSSILGIFILVIIVTTVSNIFSRPELLHEDAKSIAALKGGYLNVRTLCSGQIRGRISMYDLSGTRVTFKNAYGDGGGFKCTGQLLQQYDLKTKDRKTLDVRFPGGFAVSEDFIAYQSRNDGGVGSMHVYNQKTGERKVLGSAMEKPLADGKYIYWGQVSEKTNATGIYLITHLTRYNVQTGENDVFEGVPMMLDVHGTRGIYLSNANNTRNNAMETFNYLYLYDFKTRELQLIYANNDTTLLSPSLSQDLIAWVEDEYKNRSIESTRVRYYLFKDATIHTAKETNRKQDLGGVAADGTNIAYLVRDKRDKRPLPPYIDYAPCIELFDTKTQERKQLVCDVRTVPSFSEGIVVSLSKKTGKLHVIKV